MADPGRLGSDHRCRPDRELVVAVASVGTEEFDIPEYDASFLLDNVSLPVIG